MEGLSVLRRGSMIGDTYFATLSLVDARTVANSLMRCGRLPVFSSCSMTAITMSSLMPSVSILVSKCESPGEGGGVCSKPARRLLGLETTSSVAEMTDAPEEDTGDTGLLWSCDRLILLEGGGSTSVVGVDFRGER